MHPSPRDMSGKGWGCGSRSPLRQGWSSVSYAGPIKLLLIYVGQGGSPLGPVPRADPLACVHLGDINDAHENLAPGPASATELASPPPPVFPNPRQFKTNSCGRQGDSSRQLVVAGRGEMQARGEDSILVSAPNTALLLMRFLPWTSCFRGDPWLVTDGLR